MQQWVPRYGYKRATVEHEKDWVLEVPQNADPYEDQFEKKSEAKSERVAKNELQRLKNIARARKVEVPGTGLIPTIRPSVSEASFNNTFISGRIVCGVLTFIFTTFSFNKLQL